MRIVFDNCHDSMTKRDGTRPGVGARRMAAAMAVLLCVAADPAAALDRCKAKIAKDGTIEFQGTVESGKTNPRWGWTPDVVSLSFPNEATCYSGERLTGCNIGQPGADARRPPKSCTVYATDSGGTICAAFIKGCAPGAQDVGDDGVVYIDQGRALTGGITPGDTPGFPVTLSSRGSYRHRQSRGSRECVRHPCPGEQRDDRPERLHLAGV